MARSFEHKISLIAQFARTAAAGAYQLAHCRPLLFNLRPLEQEAARFARYGLILAKAAELRVLREATLIVAALEGANPRQAHASGPSWRALTEETRADPLALLDAVTHSQTISDGLRKGYHGADRQGLEQLRETRFDEVGLNYQRWYRIRALAHRLAERLQGLERTRSFPEATKRDRLLRACLHGLADSLFELGPEEEWMDGHRMAIWQRADQADIERPTCPTAQDERIRQSYGIERFSLLKGSLPDLVVGLPIPYWPENQNESGAWPHPLRGTIAVTPEELARTVPDLYLLDGGTDRWDAHYSPDKDICVARKQFWKRASDGRKDILVNRVLVEDPEHPAAPEAFAHWLANICWNGEEIRATTHGLEERVRPMLHQYLQAVRSLRRHGETGFAPARARNTLKAWLLEKLDGAGRFDEIRDPNTLLIYPVREAPEKTLSILGVDRPLEYDAPTGTPLVRLGYIGSAGWKALDETGYRLSDGRAVQIELRHFHKKLRDTNVIRLKQACTAIETEEAAKRAAVSAPPRRHRERTAARPTTPLSHPPSTQPQPENEPPLQTSSNPPKLQR